MRPARPRSGDDSYDLKQVPLSENEDVAAVLAKHVLRLRGVFSHAELAH